MTARPIRRNAQTPDRNGKIFYTSTTSLSHISKRAAFIRKIDHRPPSWAIEIAKPQKRERRLHHNAAVHPKQEAREQHVRQVRQDVPHGNMGAAVAEDPAVFDNNVFGKRHDYSCRFSVQGTNILQLIPCFCLFVYSER